MKKLLVLGLLFCTWGIYSTNNEKKDDNQTKAYQLMVPNYNKSNRVKAGTISYRKKSVNNLKKNGQIGYQCLKSTHFFSAHDVKKFKRQQSNKKQNMRKKK